MTIRNPEPETRNKSEDQIPKRSHAHVLDVWAFGIWSSDLFRVSGSGFRAFSPGPGVRYFAAVNGAAAKLTLKRLHQMETTRYLPRSTVPGSS